MIHAHAIIEDYRRRFGNAPCCLARAPGRVNLIGEHTDYNDGLVLPFAIEQSIYIAAGLGRPGTVTVHSTARGETVSFSVRVAVPATEHVWQNYVRGVVRAFGLADIELPGVNLGIGGDLTSGGGLSSSAALCVACALALGELVAAELTQREIVFLAQGVEHEFAGTQAGIMDPYVSVFGRAGHAVLIDCRNSTHECVPLNLADAHLLVIDSGIRHALAAGAYLQRVLECRQAAAALATLEPAVHSLRDVTEAMLEAHRARLDDVAFRRARHVVSENRRVLQLAKDLRSGSIDWVGGKLREGHKSLRCDYEVTCPEIDEIIELLRKKIDVLGARMIGGGFGGMVLALTHGDVLHEITAFLDRTYNRRHSPPARVFEVFPSDGAECMAL